MGSFRSQIKDRKHARVGAPKPDRLTNYAQVYMEKTTDKIERVLSSIDLCWSEHMRSTREHGRTSHEPFHAVTVAHRHAARQELINRGAWLTENVLPVCPPHLGGN